MTVKELIDQLKSLPDDMEVIISKDAEGNSHSPMYNVSEGWYVPDSTWSGDFYSDEDDIDTEEAEKVLCLWPTN